MQVTVSVPRTSDRAYGQPGLGASNAMQWHGGISPSNCYGPPWASGQGRSAPCNQSLDQRIDFAKRARVQDQLAQDPGNAKLKDQLNAINNKIVSDYAMSNPGESAMDPGMKTRNDAAAKVKELEMERRAAAKKPAKEYGGWDKKRAAIAGVDKQLAAARNELNDANASVARDLEDGRLNDDASPRCDRSRTRGHHGGGFMSKFSNFMKHLFGQGNHQAQQGQGIMSQISNFMNQLFQQGGFQLTFDDRGSQAPRGSTHRNYFG